MIQKLTFLYFILVVGLFFSIPINAQLNTTTLGSAVDLGGNCYRLTEYITWQSGAVWYDNPINLDNDFTISFQGNFGSNDNGADGMAFVLKDNPTAIIGNDGGFLGYGGIIPSLSVEFDAYRNNWGDLFEDHIAIMQDGNPDHNLASNLAGPVQASATNVNIEDGEEHEIKIEWNATTTTLSIYFDCNLRLTYIGDIINSIFSGNNFVYFGFVGSTGASANLNKVCFNNISFVNNLLLQDEEICEEESINVDATTPSGISYSWTPTTGVSNPNIANPTITPTSTTTYTVSVVDTCGDTFDYSIDITVHPQPVANPLSNLIKEDIGNDNVEIFDLTTQNTTLLGSQDPTQYTISYHTSQSDAENDANAIANPTVYGNTSSPQTIYVRIENTTTNCFSTTNFQLILNYAIGTSGKEANVWYFGNKAGLDFNTSPPTALTDGELDTAEGCTSISDTSGNLLFYTDGITVWDANHTVMPNGTGLNGHPSSTQSAIIVPKPNDSNKYYIFTVDEETGSDGLQYSEIDMTLNSGLGDITSNKNVLLETPVLEKIAAVKNGNKYWVVAHKYGTNEFIAYSITETGVADTPIISVAGATINNPLHTLGYLNISPDGSKIAVANYQNSVEVFDFNTSTGVVSNAITLEAVANTEYYGISFSPNSKILYMSTVRTSGLEKGVYQYNLEAGDAAAIVASRYTVVSGDTPISNDLGALQLGPDKKIYLAQHSATFLSTINSPNSVGAACDFQANSVDLNGRESILGLPPFIASIFQPVEIEAQDMVLCDNIADGSDGIAQFDLTTQNSNILQSLDPNDYTITYHSSETDADTGVNPLTNPYTNTSNPQTIYVRLEENATGFTAVSDFDLMVNPTPTANTLQDITKEDIGNDGVEVFDLTIQNTTLLGGQDPTEYTISYHTSQSDADTDANAISNSTTYTNTSNPQTIYTRIENNSTGCFATNNFQLILESCDIDTYGKEANIWYFGQNVGLNFNTSPPTVLIDGQLNTIEGCATISDTDGNLLFYTDGITVWNANHTIMSNGTGLNGHPSATQSAIIIPKPNNEMIYYIFTVDREGVNDGLQYSEVDMSLDGGLGAITTVKNVLLETPVAEKIAAVKNGDDYWVVAHKYGNNEFIAYSITETGVTSTPIISAVGATINSPSQAIGYLNISPDGSKIAVANKEDSVEVFDFNPSTGMVSNPITLEAVTNTAYYGISFSPNSKVLYMSTMNSSGLGKGVYQYNLEAGNEAAIIASKYTVISGDTPVSNALGNLQLGSDKKLYLAQAYSTFLSTINSPNNLGVACDFQTNSVDLNGRQSTLGLPSFIASIFQEVQDMVVCDDATNDGVESFNLTTQNSDILGSLDANDYTITYHSSQTDADSGINSLTSPYTNTSNPQTIYARLEKNATGCATVSNFDLMVNPTPIANTLSNLTKEDIGNDNIEVFDLTTQNTTLLGSQDPTQYTISYHTSQSDADTDANAISNSTTYTNTSNPQTIYARIENNSTGCFATNNFQLILENCSNTVLSRKEANVWYFGVNIGLDFNTSPPTVSTDSQMNTGEGCASIADANGNLLFYTDGITVWNANHTVMPNGTGLNGHSSSTQSAIIVPKPNDSNKYYIFTADALGGTDGLQYSEVDMSLNGGLGAITIVKNVLLETPVAEKIAVVKNGSDYWVVAHKYGNNEFIAYSVTETGVNNTPIISAIGSSINNPIHARGYLKISSDGSKMAVASTKKSLEIFDFNINTGVVSNAITLEAVNDDTEYYGISFSPNNKILYVSTMGYDGLDKGVYQYNLEAGDTTAIIASKYTVVSGDTPISGTLGALQLGPNQKLYLAHDSSGYISTINSPNSLGATCDFQANSVYLNGRWSELGLPSFITSIFQQVQDMVVVDDISNDGVEQFDLTTQNTSLLGNQDPTDYTITYHTSQTDTDANINAISNPTAYTNISNPQTIYARLENNPIGCINTANNFDLIVNPNVSPPPPINCNTALSSKEANIWYFGENAGLDFNSGIPIALTEGQMNTEEGCTSIADTNGNLLFYTDGTTVWNRNHQMMSNGTGLNGDNSATQSTIIVPKPNNALIYYIFTVDKEGGNNGLQYSEIDMTLDGGLGDITTFKNVLLETPVAEKIAAVKSGNNYWLVAHKYDSNEFIAYSITETGITNTPIISAVGTTINDSLHTVGYLNISPDGSKIAVANYQNSVEIFDFDPSTGVVSNPITLEAVNDERYYGVSFSPNSKLLYMSTIISSSLEKGVYQYNLEAGDATAIIASRYTVISGDSPISDVLGALQLGPDKKLYLAQHNSTFLSTINSPNSLGVACDFQANSIHLNGKLSRYGLPTFIASIFQSIQAQDMVVCDDATNDGVGQFNLATQNSDVLGSLDANDYTITYHSSQTDADTGINSLTNPYTNTSNPQTIYARLEENATGCINVSNFDLIVNPNVTPTFTQVNPICSGDAITPLPTTSNNGIIGSWSPTLDNTSTTTYTFTPNAGQCATTTTTMTITVNPTPTADAPTDVTACDSYTLPALTSGNYFTETNGGGTAYTTGDVITTTTTLFVYAESGTAPNCTDENSFTITINPTPTADAPTDVTACDSYTLPALTTGNYFTETNGGGTAHIAGDVISTTTTLFVYAESGTTPNCTDENSFTITINQTPTADAPTDVTACDSYTLPALTTGNYFTETNGGGTAYTAGDVITTTTTLFVYAESGTTPNCTDENSFTITINPTPTADAPTDVTACDSYTLPELTTGNYFTETNGGGTAHATGDVISTTTTLFVYAESGTTPNCTDENSFTITILPTNNTIIFDVEMIPLHFGNNYGIRVNAAGGSGRYEYRLDNGVWQAERIFDNIQECGQHIVAVRDVVGCNQKQGEFTILDYPKFFTPNNDGYNDTWNIDCLSEQPNAVISIFNRYGMLLKQLKPSDGIGWDGYYNGYLSIANDYWFTVEYSSNGINKQFKAHFSLLK